jgi:putative acetyltransferase
MAINVSLHVRPALATEHGVLMTVWERSVRATHDFLNEADIGFYRPLVAEYFAGPGAALWVLADESDVAIGFLGLDGDSIAALFIDPAHRRTGGGRRLVSHAQSLSPGALSVDVNEHNIQARGFYEALGFSVLGRSPVDEFGRPFPILHMRRGAEWRPYR